MLHELTEKQKEYIRNSGHRWNIKHGATRSGKTYLDYYLIPLRVHERREGDGVNVILGTTQTTIQRNVLEPMRNIWGRKNVSGIRSDNSCYIFGEKVYVLGAEKSDSVDRLRGSSIKYCYGDEITTWNEGAFEMLKSRLDKPYSIFEGTTNPRSPNHWLKEFLDSDADIFQQHYTIDDNPFLDTFVKEQMKKEYTGVFYDRYIRGLWVLAEGLIYPMFQDALSDPPDDVPATDYVLSIDYGTQNPFAALLWEKHGDVWYATRGYYHDGRKTGRQKTDTEYGEDLDEFVADIVKDFPTGKKLQTIIDPSAASFIALMRRKSWCKVSPGVNTVMDGIRTTQVAMQSGFIKISPSIKEWQDEAGTYSWDDGDRPLKENDHYMDATRYFVMTKHVVKLRKIA